MPLTSERPKTKTKVVEARDKEKLLTKAETRILEKVVEDYLVQRIKDCGLDQRKLNPQMCKGIPDRLVFDPKGLYNPQFVETKRDFKAKASSMQLYLAKGLNTVFIHSKEDVEYFLWMYFLKTYKKPTK